MAETTTDAQGETGEATVSVTVTLGDAAKRDGLDGAPVTVSLERSRADERPRGARSRRSSRFREAALPLEQVAGDGTRSLVAVETGRFADGFVEVEGKGIRKGLKVVVPS